MSKIIEKMEASESLRCSVKDCGETGGQWPFQAVCP